MAYVTGPDTAYAFEDAHLGERVHAGEPTGEVACLRCGAVAKDDCDPAHDGWCPQRDAD